MESIRLGPEVASVPLARHFVQEFLNELGLETAIAVLLTSELVSNVVRHARTDFTVTLAFDECLRVEVHDGEAATETFREILNAAPAPADVPVTSPGRRGLPLLRHLATRFGLADERGIWDGKIVWFELDFDPRNEPH